MICREYDIYDEAKLITAFQLITDPTKIKYSNPIIIMIIKLLIKKLFVIKNNKFYLHDNLTTDTDVYYTVYAAFRSVFHLDLDVQNLIEFESSDVFNTPVAELLRL